MREEITEPQHWRATSLRKRSWSSGYRSHSHVDLAAEAVDAALAEDASRDDACVAPIATDIVSSLSSQLDLLEQQREQLQKLLDQAKASS